MSTCCHVCCPQIGTIQYRNHWFGEGELASSQTEPTLGPLNINATAVSAFEIQVSWVPIHQLSTDMLLRGYEVCSTWQL